MAYDRMGRNIAIVSPNDYKADKPLSEMERTEFTYDSLGKVIKQTEVFQKMSLNGVYEWIKAWGNVPVKTYEYDALGNQTRVTDALGNSTESNYNLAGLLDYSIDAETKANGLPYTVKYTYNGLKQKVKESYQGSTYSYTYDGIGNLLSTQVNDIFKSSATYDYLGRMLSAMDGNGNIKNYKWNAFGTESIIETPGDSTIASGNTKYQYDKLGNLIYTTDSMGKITTYGYDSLGRKLRQSVSDANREHEIKESTSYDFVGNILTQTDGNGNITSYTYDKMNRVATKENALGQVTLYSYDANGNLIHQVDYLGNKSTKVYDGINRLVTSRGKRCTW